MKRVRVVIVDDHEVVRLGLIALFEDLDWIEVVAEAGSAEMAVTAVSEYLPDVVLMDIRLPENSGIDACLKITTQWPDTKVIMLTSYGNDSLILQALQAGACHYILKQVGNQALIDNLDLIRQGKNLLTPNRFQKAIDNLYEQMESQHDGLFKLLTWREMQILLCVSQGLNNPQIAKKLSISEPTISNDMNAILDKLPVNNRFEAAIYALRHNISFWAREWHEKL